MKIVVFSDTHGNQALAAQALDLAGHADHIIHLGDETDDATFLEALSGITVTKVLGNCDFATDTPREAMLVLEEKRFLLTHGDLYGVKAGLDKLSKRATAEKADVVLYGHTHIQSVCTIDGVLYVNPGCLKKGYSEPSFALLSLEKGTLSADIVPLHPTSP
ncbi:metallophosphoesterase [Geobacter sp.]|uniref:metallophosphoesterase family protein n=1 Tax=Geobacter sp. TaxID=46610 RepID=UPI0027B8B658|nr:metallophosphoesterase [Geobacter sp.]